MGKAPILAKGTFLNTFAGILLIVALVTHSGSAIGPSAVIAVVIATCCGSLAQYWSNAHPQARTRVVNRLSLGVHSFVNRRRDAQAFGCEGNQPVDGKVQH
jgi:hypothetical protein